LHPLFFEYQSYFLENHKEREEVILFLSMVKLQQKRLAWALHQKEGGKKNKELLPHLGIKLRRFQQLCVEYRKTGQVPTLIPQRRPKTYLRAEQKELIRKAAEKSKICGAVALRLYIQKYYGVSMPRNKLHAFLIQEGISREDEKKKKQRKYCRYERKHSFSLEHLDWHESRAVPGKQVCVVEDDASRLLLAGDEFDHATAENTIVLMKQAITFAFEQYSAVIWDVNTDRSSQFYANKFDRQGEKGKSEFEVFLEKEGIKHIPSRRNHPQTNGKEERWFRTYEENRNKFKSFQEFMQWYNERIHLGLSRTEGITPAEAVLRKLQPSSILGIFLALFLDSADAGFQNFVTENEFNKGYIQFSTPLLSHNFR